MSEQKPVTFKSKKPATQAPAPEHESAVEVKETTPEPLTEDKAAKLAEESKDWAAKIAAAKDTAKAEADKEKEIEEAMQRIEAQAAAAEASAPKKEEPKEQLKTEPKKEAPKAEKKPSDDDEIPHYWDESVGLDPVKGNADYVPSDEEKARAEKIKDVDANDASDIVSCRLGSENELAKAFDKIAEYMDKYKGLTQEDIDANPEIKSHLQWLADLRAVLDSSLHTDQQKLIMGMISALNKHGKTIKQLDKKLSISKMSATLAANGQPKLLRGDAAMQMINNRYRGVYRIQLHNSGFWIKLIPLRNADVDAWMQEVDFERKQIGRIVGGHFYLGMNIYLKEKMADLLRLCVVDSNLENWKEGTVLVDSISIHDYDTLCWAFCTMMFKDGVSISTVCVNPECRYHNKTQYLDLARMAYINPDVYTEEAMQFMLAGSAPGVIRTQKDIKTYKEKMLKNVRLVKFTNTDQYELKDPSLGEFIRVGMATLGKLAAKVKDGKLNNDDPEVRRYSVYHLSKMLSPWISKIVLNDDNGKMIGIIDDREAITANLETTMKDEFRVIESIEEFITNSKVSFYASMSLKCPKCGHQLDLMKDNIFPFDVEYLLFCLSYLKLDQISVTL